MSNLWERRHLCQCLSRSKASLTGAESVLKDFEEIPCPPALPLLGNMLDLVKNGSRLDKYNDELQAKYGDIVRMYSPGVFGHMVMMYKPKDIKLLFSEEERIPFSPGTVQYSTVQYSTVQYSTAQYSTVQYSTVQYSKLAVPTSGWRFPSSVGGS